MVVAFNAKTMRDNVIKIRTTRIEEILLKAKAKAVGLPVSKYLRQLGLGEDIPIRIDKRFSPEEKEQFRTLTGLANNMNQIAKKYNQGDRQHVELVRVLAQVDQVIKKIMHDDREDENR
jgi:hypothetical protein